MPLLRPLRLRRPAQLLLLRWLPALPSHPPTQANDLFWSSAGHYIILAGLKGFNGQFQFYNVDELETMTTTKHFMPTDIEWDHTGRYVATSVTSVHEMENGFNIWSFNGVLLYRILKDHSFPAHRESTGTVLPTDGHVDPVAAAEGIAFCRACARFGLDLYLYHGE